MIKDPQVAKLLADPIRRGILHNLRHQELSPFQLAKVLGKNVSSISYHLHPLEKAGLIELSKTRVTGNLVKKFYRATARTFVISYTLSEGLVPGSEEIVKQSKEVYLRAASSLDAFGHRVTDEEIEKWAEMIDRYSSMRGAAYEEVIASQKKPTHLERPALQLLLGLLTQVRLYRNPEYIEMMRRVSRELSEREAEKAVVRSKNRRVSV